MEEFKLNVDTGLLKSALYLPSAFCDNRPENNEISVLVLHNISLPPGTFTTDDVEAFFGGTLNVDAHPYFKTIAHLTVSSHLYIKRTGVVIQFVPFHMRAWHAGISYFKGRDRCNDFSIGIELQGTDHLPYTDEQYKQLVKITRLLQKQYCHISLENIVGHSTIAPERKTDPGPAFNWNYFYRLLSL